jgi:hypothetical protein
VQWSRQDDWMSPLSSSRPRRDRVSLNDLTDHEAIDELTGNAAFNGVRVHIESL